METERARKAASVVKFKCFLDVPVCARVQRVYPLYCTELTSPNFCTGWLDRMSDRKQRNGQNEQHWPVWLILPISLFPV